MQASGPGAAGRLRLRPGLRRVQRESGALTGKEHSADLTAAGAQGTCGDNCAWCSAGCKDGCCK